jgi:hypothetical protein
MISTDLGVWLAAFFLLGFWSSLYKDNIWYKFTEYTFVGVAVGNSVVFAWRSVKKTGLDPLLLGEVIWILPILLGVLILFRISPQYRWVSRWPMSVLVGTTVAVSVRGVVGAQILGQVTTLIEKAAIVPGIFNNINNYIIIIGTICTLMYFVYNRAQRGLWGYGTRLGRLMMMSTFGNLMTQCFLSRCTGAVFQVKFLLKTWLGL